MRAIATDFVRACEQVATAPTRRERAANRRKAWDLWSIMPRNDQLAALQDCDAAGVGDLALRITKECSK